MAGEMPQREAEKPPWGAVKAPPLAAAATRPWAMAAVALPLAEAASALVAAGREGEGSAALGSAAGAVTAWRGLAVAAVVPQPRG